jgi:hypothetical protein
MKIMEFESTCAGIPCIIDVFSFGSAPDSRSDNDWDYYGMPPEWGVCDRRGRPAPWLEAKLSDEDRCRIEAEVFKNNFNDDP